MTKANKPNQKPKTVKIDTSKVQKRPVELAILKQIREKAEDDMKGLAKFVEANRPIFIQMQEQVNRLAPVLKNFANTALRIKQEQELAEKLEKLGQGLTYTREWPAPPPYEPEPQEIEVKIDYKQLARAMMEVTQEMEEKKQREKEDQSKITLYFTEDGDLYSKANPTRKCHFDTAADRYKLIKYLAENKGYQPTDVIRIKIEAKTYRSVEHASRGINKATREESGRNKNLGLELKLIEGDTRSGYRINPSYQVIPK